MEFVKCSPHRNIFSAKSSNHENCNIKFRLNSFSEQITICQISFEILMSNKSMLKQKSKYFNLIRVFLFFPFIFLSKWNKREIFNKRRHKKDQEQSTQPATLLKKKLCNSCFPVNFSKFLRTPFLTEHLQWLHLKHGKLQSR